MTEIYVALIGGLFSLVGMTWKNRLERRTLISASAREKQELMDRWERAKNDLIDDLKKQLADCRSELAAERASYER